MLTVRETFCTFARTLGASGVKFVEWDLLLCLCDCCKVLERVKKLLRCTEYFILLHHICQGCRWIFTRIVVDAGQNQGEHYKKLKFFLLYWRNLNTISFLFGVSEICLYQLWRLYSSIHVLYSSIFNSRVSTLTRVIYLHTLRPQDFSRPQISECVSLFAVW